MPLNEKIVAITRTRAAKQLSYLGKLQFVKGILFVN